MAGTDGDWLPDAARARLARYDAVGLKTSLLSVAGTVGVESVGLRPVGEVMGCIVQNIGWTGGMNYGVGGFVGSVSFQPYVQALYHGFDTALARMTTEAKSMEADGIVGVRLTRARLGENSQEFVALGTAVRAESSRRPRRVFTTDLAGQDVAKLMQAGWVPTRIAIGIAVESQFLDWASRSQMSVMAGNTEVTAYTQLINRVRAKSRQSFASHARGTRADGAIVASMGLRSWHQEAGNAPLLCAESSVFGTTIARFHSGQRAPTQALTIMPLRQAGQQQVNSRMEKR
ncbi:MAG TPA: heavy metal-binding domain-containing protein [Pseudonocardiaceae bacterium]|nr:heavy metal-binding domain-containing protein [Pseudonocardiaceae bacterium]